MPKNLWKANERKARKLAAEDYDRRWEENYESPERANDGVRPAYSFRRENPRKESYVNEWWCERYLPQVLAQGNPSVP